MAQITHQDFKSAKKPSANMHLATASDKKIHSPNQIQHKITHVKDMTHLMIEAMIDYINDRVRNEKEDISPDKVCQNITSWAQAVRDADQYLYAKAPNLKPVLEKKHDANKAAQQIYQALQNNKLSILNKLLQWVKNIFNDRAVVAEQNKQTLKKLTNLINRYSHICQQEQELKLVNKKLSESERDLKDNLNKKAQGSLEHLDLIERDNKYLMQQHVMNSRFSLIQERLCNSTTDTFAKITSAYISITKTLKTLEVNPLEPDRNASIAFEPLHSCVNQLQAQVKCAKQNLCDEIQELKKCVIQQRQNSISKTHRRVHGVDI